MSDGKDGILLKADVVGFGGEGGCVCVCVGESVRTALWTKVGKREDW